MKQLKLIIKYGGTILPCPALKEYDPVSLNKLGIQTPNLHTKLQKVKIYPGNKKYPLYKARD